MCEMLIMTVLNKTYLNYQYYIRTHRTPLYQTDSSNLKNKIIY